MIVKQCLKILTRLKRRKGNTIGDDVNLIGFLGTQEAEAEGSL